MQAQTTNVNSESPMLSLEIGGLVTNLHKSFLQDTSPPSSICTSLNNGCMNNSLISSADFTNLNFLQSIHSLETNTNPTRDPMSTMTTLVNDVGYNLSDMIKDRKVLEALSMSGDGTLIKDSHIGQIDDISLMPLSRTASGCSTMDNSTDSFSTQNEMQLLQQSHAHKQGQAEAQLCVTMVLSDELIGDTTFNLADSQTSRITTESQSEGDANATFKRPIAVLNETQLLAGRQVNSTFTEGCHTPEAARCDTPENIETKLSLIQMQSTPLTTVNTRCPYNYNNNNKNNNNNNNKVPPYTPTQRSRDEIVNISPIVSSTTPHTSFSYRQELNQTYEPPTGTLKDLQLRGAPEGFDGQKFVHDTMHLLEQIEQPATDATYEKSDEYLQMQCVLDLAEAEVELLAHQGDEEQFEHMLAELGKVNTLNAEQIKMQKSLDSIKRRFQKDEEHPPRSEQQQQVVNLVQDKPPSTKSHLMVGQNQSNSQSSSSSERLLSRRSRLYDDVKLNALHDSVASTASCNSTSFIVHRREEDPANTSGTCIPLLETEKHMDMKTEQHKTTTESESLNYKMADRRTRDRERFKTIKITSEMRVTDEKLGNIVVPCIDDEDPQSQPLNKIEDRQQSPQNRLSRLDKKSLGNINGLENNAVGGKNYLTYKKPREKNLLMQKQTQTQPPALECGQNDRSQPRSLSRPRYISGLQKLGTVGKATSAGGGLNAISSAISKAISRETAPKPEDGVKSPMGIKSKSFNNLSSNTCRSMGAGGEVSPPRQSLGDALKIPSDQVSKLSSVFREAQQNEVCSTIIK